MSDDLSTHRSMVTKGPLSDEIEGLDCDATASNPTIKPIERLGPTSGEVELNPHLTGALRLKAGLSLQSEPDRGPPLETGFDPLPGSGFGQSVRHCREPGYVGISAGLGYRRRISDPKRTQSDVESGERRIGWHEFLIATASRTQRPLSVIPGDESVPALWGQVEKPGVIQGIVFV
ncbi:MAG: hypothetical protein R2714_10360 [Microthrixaceae bacterium]